MKATQRLFRAFADPTRLRILNLLAAGEACVCHVVASLRQPQSKVSRHLAALRRAGLVRDRKDGLWRRYSLAEARGQVHRELIGCLSPCLREIPVLRRDLAALKGVMREPRLCAPRRSRR